ncbi:MAG TPA: hypothetical protein DEA50_16050 [Parvularcula sp.]|nr:hypothetical protein [Parvularcula sp.]
MMAGNTKGEGGGRSTARLDGVSGGAEEGAFSKGQKAPFAAAPRKGIGIFRTRPARKGALSAHEGAA